LAHVFIAIDQRTGIIGLCCIHIPCILHYGCIVCLEKLALSADLLAYVVIIIPKENACGVSISGESAIQE
jgi:hypothetical protein